MSFGTITIDATTFVETQRGKYIANNVPFGGPRNEVRITPGSLAAKANPPVVNAGVTRLFEIPITDAAGITKIHRAVATLSLQVEPGTPVAVPDALVGELSTLVTEQFLNQVLNGGY